VAHQPSLGSCRDALPGVRQGGCRANTGRVPLCLNERAEWELPGGRLEPGEALRAAVEREVLEELGLAVAAGALLDAWTYEPAGADATVVVIAYAARLLDGATELRCSAEHREARWFAVGDLRDLTMPEPYKRAIRLSAR